MSRESMAEKLRRVSMDDRVRRDLLWLRAQEKGDDRSIELLERADPDLRSRMDQLMAATRPDLLPDPEERRKAFARLWREYFDRL